MNTILDNEDNPFTFFHDLGMLDFKHKGLENQFKVIDEFVKSKNYYVEFHTNIIIDYLNYFNLKPKAWWDEHTLPKIRNNILRLLQEKGLLSYSINELYKYALLVDLENDYIIALYSPNNKQIISINKKQIS